MAHTPGPWAWDGPPDNIHVVEESRPHMRVCFLTSDGPTEANGCLIAAAPELLEALKELGLLIDFAEPASAEMPMAFDDYGPLNEAFEKARAAIAKAEGRSE